jgi:NAD(P)H-hydrate repair Nnr-like enzyme with NAD(P)H-hydrate dehydratase domain
MLGFVGYTLLAMADTSDLCNCALAVYIHAGTSHKGNHGKVSVIGGNRDYTGAPYFCAMSAMRVGADYGNVCCTSDAAKTIKTYAPELIVIPCMLQLSDLATGWVRQSPS